MRNGESSALLWRACRSARCREKWITQIYAPEAKKKSCLFERNAARRNRDALRSGNGIVSVSTPRVATQNATGGEIPPFEWSILAECLQGILRTGGSITTRRHGERRDTQLIEPYQNNERSREYNFYYLPEFHIAI